MIAWDCISVIEIVSRWLPITRYHGYLRDYEAMEPSLIRWMYCSITVAWIVLLVFHHVCVLVCLSCDASVIANHQVPCMVPRLVGNMNTWLPRCLPSNRYLQNDAYPIFVWLEGADCSQPLWVPFYHVGCGVCIVWCGSITVSSLYLLSLLLR